MTRLAEMEARMDDQRTEYEARVKELQAIHVEYGKMRSRSFIALAVAVALIPLGAAVGYAAAGTKETVKTVKVVKVVKETDGLKVVAGTKQVNYVFKSSLPQMPVIEAYFKLYPTPKQRQFLNQYGYGSGKFYRTECARWSTTGNAKVSFKDTAVLDKCSTEKLTPAQARAAVPEKATVHTPAA